MNVWTSVKLNWIKKRERIYLEGATSVDLMKSILFFGQISSCLTIFVYLSTTKKIVISGKNIKLRNKISLFNFIFFIYILKEVRQVAIQSILSPISDPDRKTHLEYSNNKKL